MRLSEEGIFYSIQGEGVYAGVPMAFLRLQGCSLRCLYCDTRHAQDPKEGIEASLESVIEELNRCPTKKVCITGGEPLLQLGAGELVLELHNKGWWITIETNGSIEPPNYWWHQIDNWVPDIKCPSSGMCGKSKGSWYGLRQQDQIKYVVGNREDLRFVDRELRQYIGSKCIKLISPIIWPEDPECPVPVEWLQECAEFCKEHTQYNCRLSLQLHKILYGNKKGV